MDRRACRGRRGRGTPPGVASSVREPARAGPIETDDEQIRTVDEVLTIAPVMARAAGWTVLGAVAIGASGWALERTTSQLVTAVAAGLLLASIVVTGLFALQVFAPRAWTLRLGGGRLQGHAMGVPVDIELLDVRSMAVERRLGDRALVVETRWRRRALLLPLGADAAAIGRVAAAVTAHGPGAGGDAV